MNVNLQKFIEQYIDLIEAGKWDTLYKQLEEENHKVNFLISTKFTETLLQSNINPLLTMSTVPSVFARKSNLQQIVIPSNIYRIEVFAFNRSKNLRKIVLEEGVQEIGSSAFEYCDSGSHVVLPSTIAHIGEWAFSYMGDITIEYDGTKKQFKELINKTRYVFDHTFYTCTCLDGVVEKKRRNR